MESLNSHIDKLSYILTRTLKLLNIPKSKFVNSVLNTNKKSENKFSKLNFGIF
jgi:hypothetical protein